MKNSTKAVLITGARSGGTFLSACLSNHPEIYWVREEPFGRQGVYFDLENDEQVLYQIYRQKFYKVNGFKTVFAELISSRLEAIFSWSPKIIFLLRKNVLEQALSGLIMHQVAIGGEKEQSIPIHSFEKVDQDVYFNIDSGDLINAAREIAKKHSVYIDWIKEKAEPYRLDQLMLYYEDLYTPAEVTHLSGITYIREDINFNLLSFLGVDTEFPLFSGLMKISDKPFSRIKNYQEVYEQVAQTELKKFWENNGSMVEHKR